MSSVSSDITCRTGPTALSSTLHSVVVRETLLQSAQRFGWERAGAGADLKVGPSAKGAVA